MKGITLPEAAGIIEAVEGKGNLKVNAASVD
jgi:hypothetical protein